MLKKGHIFTKNCFRCFLVAMEWGFAGWLFTVMTNKCAPITNEISYIERFILGTAIYELIVFITLTFINDARKDALLALKTSYQMAELYVETGEQWVKNKLLTIVGKELDSGMLNHTDVRLEYENLIKCLADNNIIQIKYMIIILENQCEMVALQWRYTLLLRLFVNGFK